MDMYWWLIPSETAVNLQTEGSKVVRDIDIILSLSGDGIILLVPEGLRRRKDKEYLRHR